MSEQEKANLKPLSIQIVTVRPGDTVVNMAARMRGVQRESGIVQKP